LPIVGRWRILAAFIAVTVGDPALAGTGPEAVAGSDAMRVTATALFALAVLHTFAVKSIQALARRFSPGSVAENFLNLCGEVEVVFGLWAGLLIAVWMARFGQAAAVAYMGTVSFTEAAFVFVIMCMAATKPVLGLAAAVIDAGARLLPLPRGLAGYIVTLTAGPLLGSCITEPAAMAVTATLVAERFMAGKSLRFRYATLGLLFVNVSIGGTLTHFAAPPVLMVAKSWGWTSAHMLAHFGWRAAIVVALGAAATGWIFRRELATPGDAPRRLGLPTPAWVVAVHLVFMALTILSAHHMSFFIPLFLFFIGWCVATQEYQEELKIRESLLVAFFLGGLVTLGNLQDWWLRPLLAGLAPGPLFWGATALTAVTDNAALTYLATLVPDLSEAAKHAVVAGAVTGGGLTVIANAPNPIGYGLLRERFGEAGISPAGLFIAALPYTLLAALFFCGF
jgi:hypothetical protein